MKAEDGQPEMEADGEPVLAVGLATAPAELVAVELAGNLSLLPVPQPLLSIPAPETEVVAEIAAPPVVEEPAPGAVPAELVAVELAAAVSMLPVPQPVLSVPAPETEVMAEIDAPPVVEEEPAGLAVPAELVAAELAVALPLLPVPQLVLAVPAPETDVVAEIAAPVAVAEIAAPVVVAAPPPPPPPPPPPRDAVEAEFAGQVERVSWLRRVRSLIALIFLAALLGATLAAIVIGIGVLIALAAQHAIG